VIAGDRLPTLVAARVRLRWLEDRDVDALFDVFSDTDVMRYWSSPPMRDRDRAVALLDEIRGCFRDRELFQWGIARIEDDRVIGTCTLAAVSATHRRAELGFALARAQWGHGYAAEALDRLLAFAFDELALHRLEADVDPRNARSIAALERLGFRKEGHLRERWHVGGEVADGLMYGLLAREWRAPARSST
jgi:RimJ/RimL family protein N-acetyltransferase